MVRVLYFQSRVSLHFWSQCVLTTTFSINKTPSPLLHHHTPYELLYKKQVDYSSFHVFRCLAFASTLTAHRTKFQPRARTCVLFICYPNGTKAYRLYDIHTKQIFVSRDVIFHKEVFPFHSVTDAASIIDPFPNWFSQILPSTLPPTHITQHHS